MALLQLCSQPTAFFAALEVDCKSLTLRHCGTWLESKRCNFTMPKRKLEFYIKVYRRSLSCNFTMPKRKLSLSSPASVSKETVATLPCQSGNDGEYQAWFWYAVGLQLYHAKAETQSTVRVASVSEFVATLPCQSGNGNLTARDEVFGFRCNFTMPKRKLQLPPCARLVPFVATLPCQSGNT